MTTNPPVSVIVPVFNGANYLTLALESVFEQEYTPLEVIVVDDGSTDESAELAQRYPVKYLYQDNQGPAAARNLGIQTAAGEFIAFIDQDDIWMPDKLKAQVQAMLECEECLYSVTRQEYFLEEGIEPPSWFRADILDEDRMGYLPGTLVARKNAFEEIGMFSPDFPTTSDVDWFFRAKDAEVPMLVIPQVLLRKRVHDRAQSSQAQAHNRELLNVLHQSIQRKKRHASD